YLPYLVFHVPPTTELYTLSLHDALPIFPPSPLRGFGEAGPPSSALRGFGEAGSPSSQKRSDRYFSPPSGKMTTMTASDARRATRSEEHTSELQSPCNLVCRLLLEKKKTN